MISCSPGDFVSYFIWYSTYKDLFSSSTEYASCTTAVSERTTPFFFPSASRIASHISLTSNTLSLLYVTSALTATVVVLMLVVFIAFKGCEISCRWGHVHLFRFTCPGDKLGSFLLTAGSTQYITPQCTHFAATVCTVNNRISYILLLCSALQASMNCKVFIKTATKIQTGN